jgi:hypothetical protein
MYAAKIASKKSTLQCKRMLHNRHGGLIWAKNSDASMWPAQEAQSPPQYILAVVWWCN